MPHQIRIPRHAIGDGDVGRVDRGPQPARSAAWKNVTHDERQPKIVAPREPSSERANVNTDAAFIAREIVRIDGQMKRCAQRAGFGQSLSTVVPSGRV